MATEAYWAWARSGRPWKVAAPIKQLGDRLKAYGYTVYYLGSDDRSHLQASKPEDHCPFSFTGWPSPHPYPYVTACDIMPPPKGSGLPSLQQLGARIVADRNSGEPGLAWLKYMNWEPDGDYRGRCWQDSWKPTHARRDSADRGHIHASGRSDKVTDSGPAYDPVARIRGTAPTPGGPDMQVITIARDNSGQWYACTGSRSWPINQAQAIDIAHLAKEGRWDVCWGLGGVGTPRDGWYPEAFGPLDQPAGAVTVTADLMKALGDQVLANVGPAVQRAVEAAIEARVEAAVRRVLGGLDGAVPPA